MKITILNSARKFIGEAAHCLALAEQLSLRGHTVTLAVRRGCELEQRASGRAIPLLPLTFNGGFHPIKDGQDLLTLRRHITTWQPDLLHCHRGKDHWLAAIAAGNRLPIARTRHVVVPMASHLPNRWLMTNRTDGAIAVSEAAACSLGPLRSLLGQRLSVILSAVDTERFSPAKRSEPVRAQLGAAPETLLVGLVGRLQRIKGQDIFLQAAALVARTAGDKVRFLIAGRGTEEKFARLRRRAEELGIADRVEFRGWLEDVEATIASLDVGVVASLGSEGSSRITYECMASGVPVAATTVGGIPEILTDGETGLLVSPGDVEALAGAIGRLIETPDIRAQLTTAALARIHEHHTFDRWIADTVRVYDGAIRNSKSR
ncbi:MAG: glycosyltransferase [Gemmatimonadetes bacterium]|nr:glycosyltransferase [Gemmatimonadota bacterium]